MICVIGQPVGPYSPTSSNAILSIPVSLRVSHLLVQGPGACIEASYRAPAAKRCAGILLPLYECRFPPEVGRSSLGSARGQDLEI